MGELVATAVGDEELAVAALVANEGFAALFVALYVFGVVECVGPLHAPAVHGDGAGTVRVDVFSEQRCSTKARQCCNAAALIELTVA